jgi:hypothetical protein
MQSNRRKAVEFQSAKTDLSILPLGWFQNCSEPRVGPVFFDYFTRQTRANPIKRQQTGERRDKGAAIPVQNILKKVKKNLVRYGNLH